MIPVELKELLDKAAGKEHSATGSVMTTLAELLTIHEKTWVETLEWVQALRRQERGISEARMILVVAHERLIRLIVDVHRPDIYGTEEWAQVERLRRELDAASCLCCVFGNHTEQCTCDGARCRHPENHQ
jgi:hypothetical protein